MVLFNVGPNRMDPTCVGEFSLPHLLISSDPGHSERLMASGNERTRTSFNSPYAPKEKLGYYMNPEDKFRFILDFMNEKDEDRIVYLTMTYDYIQGRPEGFSNYRTIWLDIAQCGTSEVRPPSGKVKFDVSQDWVANLNGDILVAGGHLHDGGTHIALTVDGKEVCDSVASYSNNSAGGAMGGGGMANGGAMAGMNGKFVSLQNLANLEKRDSPNHGMSLVEHISKMGVCAGSTMVIRQVKKGQTWRITAYYDYDQHKGMIENGRQSNVMGIVVMMVKNWSV
jgi:hypothetical protein